MLTTASDTPNVSMQRNSFVTTKTITPTILSDERRKRTKNVTNIILLTLKEIPVLVTKELWDA